MSDQELEAAIRARDAENYETGLDVAGWDRRTLLRMLDEARETLFEAQQALLKEGMERDEARAENERLREALGR